MMAMLGLPVPEVRQKTNKLTSSDMSVLVVICCYVGTL